MLVLAGISAGTLACSRAERSAASAESTGAPPAANVPASPQGEAGSSGSPEKSAGAITSETQAKLEEALSSYEEIRSRLSLDAKDGVGAAAAAMEKALRAAVPAAPEALRQQLEDTASAAGEVKGLADGDLEKLRVSFATLSRGVVGVLAAEPALAKGRYVFECPMVDHYKKWVQVQDGISNPYMGSRMPGCGLRSEWKD